MAVLLAAATYLSSRVERLEAALESMATQAAQKPTNLPDTPALAPPSDKAPAATPRPVTARGDLSGLEQSTIEVFSKRSKAVAHITTVQQVRRGYFQRNILQVPSGTGSGFVWDGSGHVVTNFHVIKGADGANVTLSDQSVWNARLVGADPRHDIAVLRIEATKKQLQPVTVGSSHDLVVGQQVLAIGSPFGLDYTLTTGVISGLDREIDGVGGLPIRGAIQTDAAINPGNSGGPLLDSGGRLIGVNTAIKSPSGASAGIGFAVPVDTVARVVPMLIKYGKVVRPQIGVQLAGDGFTRRLRLKGSLIAGVQPNSPAASAGLQPAYYDRRGRFVMGDLIVGVGGEPVEKDADIHLILEKYKPGDRVQLTIVRDGKKVQADVVLGSSS